MFDAGSFKLFGGIILFAATAFLVTGLLTGRTLFGRPVTRELAQFFGALAGIVFGVSFLLALG